MRNQKGFSLVELLMVLVILTIVMGVIFQQIITLQQRYRTEEKKVDMFSEGREFMDQFTRDMHAAGFPSAKVYATPPPANSTQVAVGIAAARPTFLMMEGDVDGDGQIDSIAYTVCNSAGNCATAVNAAPGGTCPCTIKRSQVVKTALAPWQQPTFFSDSVEGLVNSAGMAGGLNPLLITGQSSMRNVAGTYVVSNDDAIF